MYLYESIAAAILPILTYLYIIWKTDKIEPEPAELILKSFLYGAFGAIAVTLVFSSVSSELLSIVFSEESMDLIDATVIAPVIEEIAKGMFLITLAKNINFDNVTDGIVYGAAIGLGFGMTENFLYFIAQDTTYYSFLTVVVLRTLFSAIMHCISTATVGAFIAMNKFSKSPAKKSLPLLGFLIAMLIHFSWNFNLSFDNTVFIAFLLMIIFTITFVTTLKLSVKKEKKLIIDELQDEAENELFPEELIPAVFGDQKGLIILNGKLDDFRTAATKLAFRKHQAKNSSATNEELYISEVQKYRSVIAGFLKDEDE